VKNVYVHPYTLGLGIHAEDVFTPVYAPQLSSRQVCRSKTGQAAV